jgi:hypothetical protein
MVTVYAVRVPASSAEHARRPYLRDFPGLVGSPALQATTVGHLRNLAGFSGCVQGTRHRTHQDRRACAAGRRGR